MTKIFQRLLLATIVASSAAAREQDPFDRLINAALHISKNSSGLQNDALKKYAVFSALDSQALDKYKLPALGQAHAVFEKYLNSLDSVEEVVNVIEGITRQFSNTAGVRYFGELNAASVKAGETILGDTTLGNLTSSGTISPTGNVTIGGTLTVALGETITAGGLTITAGGETITAGGLTITAGGATIGGTTAITGATSVVGTTSLVGAVSATTTVNVSGKLTLYSGTKSLTAMGAMGGLVTPGVPLRVIIGTGTTNSTTITTLPASSCTGAATATGIQTVTFTIPFSAVPYVTVCAGATTNVYIANISTAASATGFAVTSRIADGTATDGIYYFIAIGPA